MDNQNGKKAAERDDLRGCILGWMILAGLAQEDGGEIKGIDRIESNKRYSDVMANINTAVKRLKDVGNKDKKKSEMLLFRKSVMVASLYAAEGYHSRGALRHVIGHMQTGKLAQDIGTQHGELSKIDLLASMIENLGDTLKVMKEKCGNKHARFCLLEISKYLSRIMHAAMVLQIKKDGSWDQNNRITKLYKLTGSKLQPFNKNSENLNGFETDKKAGKQEVSEEKIAAFYQELGCHDSTPSSPYSKQFFRNRCMQKIVEIVEQGIASVLSDSDTWKATWNGRADLPLPSNQKKCNFFNYITNAQMQAEKNKVTLDKQTGNAFNLKVSNREDGSAGEDMSIEDISNEE